MSSAREVGADCATLTVERNTSRRDYHGASIRAGLIYRAQSFRGAAMSAPIVAAGIGQYITAIDAPALMPPSQPMTMRI